MSTDAKHSKNQEVDAKSFVPFSSRLTAAMRAVETEKKNGLFKDHFARRLAGPEAFELLEDRFTLKDIDYLAVRTRYFDDFILTSMGESRQIVILAAGMDTRAFRLPFPRETVVYELDHPEVIFYKNELMKADVPICSRKTIGVDLCEEWTEALLCSGYNVDLKTVWILEGLLMYLQEPWVHKLLSKISRLTRLGGRMGLDTVNVMGMEYEPFKGYFSFGVDYPERLLAGHGWKACVKQPGERGARFGRFTKEPPPRDVHDVVRVFLVTAEFG